MAAGWPTKVTYANGDVFNASDINDTNGTLNYINPTSATDNQVLTRDNVATGKVKWANSPANTLTTTGDILYASAANTPARLAAGTSGYVLTANGAGVAPSYQAATSGGMTLIATSGTLSGASYTFSSIPGTYRNLYLDITAAKVDTINATVGLRANGITGTACYATTYITSTITAGTATSYRVGAMTTSTACQLDATITIANYATSTVGAKVINSTSDALQINTANRNSEIGFGAVIGTSASGFQGVGAITSLTFINSTGSFSAGVIDLYGVK